MIVPEVIEPAGGKAWGATWIVNAPWAHPAWSQYVVLLYDLSTPTGTPPVLYLDGATHEVIVWAADPAYELLAEVPASAQQIRLLTPANHGYQFKAASNAVAQQRIQEIVDRVEAKQLSPDTDYRSVWDALFPGGASLHRS